MNEARNFAPNTRPEVSTLIEYVQALGGTLEIRVTVDDHTYIEQLV